MGCMGEHPSHRPHLLLILIKQSLNVFPLFVKKTFRGPLKSGIKTQNVMLNAFQHLIKSMNYETLARSDERE